MPLLPAVFLLAACGPDLNPVEQHLDTLDIAESLGEQGVGSYNCSSLMFDWTQAVWAYGIHRLYTATGDAQWQDCYRSWMDEAVVDFSGTEPDAFYSSDSMSPSILAASLMLEDSSLGYEAITDAADLYLAGAPRLDNGAIAHWGLDNPYGFETDQVWIDSMFMFGAYLVAMYARTGERDYLDTYLEQYEAFADLCRDPQDHLYRHAWDDSEHRNIPSGEVYWARGNAWLLVSAAELLNVVEPGSDAWDRVHPLWVLHAQAFLETQEEEDGLWHTVVNEPIGDDPENYTETSGSALIAYGLVRGLAAGAIEGDEWNVAVHAAAVGVMDRLEPRSDGKLVVEGTSFGTNPGEDYEHYVGIEQIDDMMLGYGPAIMLLSEANGMVIPSSALDS